MSARSPAYKLEDLVAACATRGQAKVLQSALDTAPTAFGLNTEDDILAWIATGGIEKPEHANTETWEKNPDPAQEVLVDSYNFYSGREYGYLAFMYSPVTNKWLIKSLKKNDKPSSRAFLLAEQLKKVGLTR